jgi:hypothetical protein
VTDAPALAWLQPEPGSDDPRPFVVIGVRVGGNDGERLVQEVMLSGHQTGEDTFAVLPEDLACEVIVAEGAVTAHLTTFPEHVAVLAGKGQEWRQRVARFLPDGPPPERVRLLTAIVPLPDGLAEVGPGVIVIDFEHGDRPEDALAAVRDGQTAYTLVSPDAVPEDTAPADTAPADATP